MKGCQQLRRTQIRSKKENSLGVKKKKKEDLKKNAPVKKHDEKNMYIYV